MPRWRPARRSGAASWVVVRVAAAPGVGAAARITRASGRSRPPRLSVKTSQDWVVLAQQRAQLVVRAGALPDGVLVHPGEHGDGLGEFGIGGGWGGVCVA